MLQDATNQCVGIIGINKMDVYLFIQG